jgi:hypothetical protein
VPGKHTGQIQLGRDAEPQTFVNDRALPPGVVSNDHKFVGEFLALMELRHRL